MVPPSPIDVEFALATAQRHREVLREITRAIHVRRRPPDLLGQIARLLGQGLAVDRVALFDVSIDGGAARLARWETDPDVAPIDIGALLAHPDARAWLWDRRYALISEVDRPCPTLDVAPLHAAPGPMSLVWLPFEFREASFHLVALEHVRAAHAWRVDEVELVADVTEQVEIVLERLQVLQNRQEALATARRNEQQLALLVSHLLAGVVFEDDTRRVQVVNDAWCRMFALESPDREVGRDFTTLAARIAPQFPAPEAFLADMTAVAAARQAQAGEVFATIDGRSLRREFVPSATGGALWLFRDVTNEQVAAGRARQGEKLAAVAQLAGGVAHEFNNLLAVIQAYASLARRDAAADSPIANDLDRVLTATDRAAAAARRLLAFSQPDALVPRELGVAATLEALTPALQRTLGPEVTLAVHIGDTLGALWVDPAALEHALVQLATNAREACRPGGTVTVSTATVAVEGTAVPADLPPGAYTTITVRDDGPGFVAGTEDRVFEAFYTTKDPATHIGLGLAFVAAFVHQSRGGVTLGPGPGAAVTLWLPQPVVPARVPLDEPASGAHERVLVIDDEPEIRTLVQRVLTREGYRVTVAAHGAEAEAWVAHHGAHLDLILCDVIMAGAHGPEVVARIAPRCPKAAVLFVSGYVDPGTDVLPPGAVLLRKPFAIDELVRAVRDRLAAR